MSLCIVSKKAGGFSSLIDITGGRKLNLNSNLLSADVSLWRPC